MRKTLELLALSTCTAALCVTLTGCEAVKGTASGEKPVKTVYVYLPDGTLLDKGRADKVSSFAHNDRICNRCRKQVFAERFDDGVFDQKALDGWALEMRNIHGIGDLCPECYKVYRETMDRFYEGGRHGG